MNRLDHEFLRCSPNLSVAVLPRSWLMGCGRECRHMMRKHFYLPWATISVLVLLAAALFLWPLMKLNRLPDAYLTSDKLKLGMSKTEANHLLGPPSGKDSDDQTWSYHVEGSWPIFYVFFDASGQVDSWELDR